MKDLQTNVDQLNQMILEGKSWKHLTNFMQTMW